MARTPRSGAPPNRPRPAAAGGKAGGAKTAAGGTAVTRSAQADPPKRRTSPAQFIQEVRVEGRKITWTSWKETWITSVMVLIMVVLAAIFFFAVDTTLSFGIQNLFRLPEILS